MDQDFYDEDNPNLDGDYKAVLKIRQANATLRKAVDADQRPDGGRGGTQRAAATAAAAAGPAGAAGAALLRRSSTQTLRLALFLAAEGDDVDTLEGYLSDRSRIDRSLADSRFRDAETGETVLHRALAHGSLKAARLLLSGEHAAALARATFDREVGGEVSKHTCLHQATEAGQLDVIKMLLEAVTDRHERAALLRKDTIHVPPGRRPRHVTCLHLAAMNGFVPIVEYLVGQCGVDVNESNAQKDTALMWASLDGRRDTVELLMRLGADVDAQNDQGSTALHYAIRRGHLDVASLLIVSGRANVNVKRKRGLVCPLVLAATMGYDSTVRLLIKSGADVNVRIHGNETALHYAAGEGHLDVCRTLVEEGIEVDATDTRGETALIEAALHGQVELVEFLLSHGADVNHLTTDRRSAWTYAVEADDERMLSVLLDHVSGKFAAADVGGGSSGGGGGGGGGSNAKSAALAAMSMLSMRLTHRVTLPDGVTPLHLAAARGDVAKLRLMLDRQLDPEARDARGNTFLHVAAAGNQWRLLEQFADGKLSAAANDEGNTALHEACRLSNDESVAVLLSRTKLHERNKCARTALHEAARAAGVGASTVRLVVSQIQQGHYWELLDAADERGYTALHWAVREGNLAALRELRSLSVRAQDEDGNTPLHLAAAAGDGDTFVELLRLHPSGNHDLSAANASGMTLLRLAVYQNSAVILEALIRAGADVSLVEQDGGTLLHWMTDLLKADESMAKIYMQMVREITNLAVTWWAKKSKRALPVHTSVAYDDMRTEALRSLFGTVVDKNGYTVLQYAARIGCAPMIEHILNLKNVYKLKVGNFYDYDVTNMTPSTMVSQSRRNNSVHPTAPAILITHHIEKDSTGGGDELAVAGTTKAARTKAAEAAASDAVAESGGGGGGGGGGGRSQASLIELIVLNEDPLSAAAILGMHPIADMVRSYWSAYQWMYAIVMLVHLLFMVLLTAYAPVLQQSARVGTNLTAALQSGAETVNCSSLQPLTFTQYILVTEPALLLLVQLLQLLSLAWRGGASAAIVASFSSRDRTSAVGPFLLRLCGTVNALTTIAWLAMYRYCVLSQDYMLSLALLFGWLYPLNFTSGFGALHQFSLMLRHMIFEDVLRFIVVYAFVLCGFGFAQHVVLGGLSEYSSNEIEDTLFTTFQWLVGMNNFWNKPSDSFLIKRYGFLAMLYIAYTVLSTIVLINLLIAMMSDSYTGVKNHSSLLWKVASVELALDTQQSLSPLEPLLRSIRSRLGLQPGGGGGGGGGGKRSLTFDPGQQRWYLRVSKARRVGPKKKAIANDTDPALVQIGQKVAAVQEQLDSLAAAIKHLVPKAQDDSTASVASTRRIDGVAKAVSWRKAVGRAVAAARPPPPAAGDRAAMTGLGKTSVS